MADSQFPPEHLPPAKQASVQQEAQEPASADWKGFINARKELLTIEAKEVGQFALGKGIAAGALVFGFLFFWLILVMALVSLVGKVLANRYDDHLFLGVEIGWEIVAVIVAVLHLLVGLIALAKLKKKPRESFFSYTMQEIEKDRQWLQKKK